GQTALHASCVSAIPICPAYPDLFRFDATLSTLILRMHFFMHNNETKPSSGPESRREFIKKTATAAAAVVATANVFKSPVYGQNQAPSTGRVIGANDRIAVAYIGVGGQGQAHVDSQKRNAADNNIVQAAV